jgi:LPXTG-site transpeptidase (sortase) family protein
MKKYALWAIPFLLGLSIAWFVAQLVEDGASSSTPSATVGEEDVLELESTSLDESPEAEANEEPVGSTIAPQASLIPEDQDDGETAAQDRSPLASIVEPLGSALPEEALEGVGDPLGFRPLSMEIPDLDVRSAPIQPVGIEDNGELEVPGAEAIGWYQFGAGIGGGRGSTVLAGHIAYNGVDGVFRNLDQMQAGQVFSVDHEGSTLSYEVTEVIQYTKEALPIEDLFREDGEERLVLITCGGSFNPSLRSYDDNVVVIAVPVAV